MNFTRRSALAALGGAGIMCRAVEAEPFTVLVDLNTGNGWNNVDAATVFGSGQEIRFRVRSSTAGYLYLLDETPLGDQSWIYPEPDGLPRRIMAGREQIVPHEGSWRVSNQPGYDILYWVISSVRLPAVPPLPIGPPRRSKTKLLPRCQDSVLRARGVCMDTEASRAQPAQSQAAVELSKHVAAAATSVEPATPGAAVLTSPGNIVVYEMRLAHK